jgi:membrane associated rhomboid family serine protease
MEEVPVYVTKFQTDFKILGYLFLFTWSIHLLDSVVLRRRLLTTFAVIPGKNFSFFRLMFSNFLHNSWKHLFLNTPSLIVLGWFTMLPETRDFWIVTSITAFVNSFGAWLFDPNPSVGTSGLVMGYFGFLISRGFFAKDSGQVLFAMAMLIFYSWLFRQIVPGGINTSKAGHFFGFAGGLLAAWVISLQLFTG